mmetsp:Transcript_104392/g.185634  ORF Transcript_104392/g.185634 Transcript_104392/m.185634 type:complete len:216 (+) Transcript_104392:36-683(+)
MAHNSTADLVFSHPESHKHLYLGPVTAAQDPKLLQELGVKYVVTVMQDPDGPVAGVEWHHVPISDANEASMLPYFEETVAKVDAWLKTGSVLIHCSSGISRSVTMTIAYLVGKEGHNLSLSSAYETVRSARSIVEPGTTFFGDLQRWELQKRPGSGTSMSLLQYYGYSIQRLLSSEGAERSHECCVEALQSVVGQKSGAVHVSEMDLYRAAQSLL